MGTGGPVVYVFNFDYRNIMVNIEYSNKLYMSRLERLQSYDTSAEAKGETIMSIVSGAGQVSSVFEQKAEDILADNGIEQLSPDAWYPLSDYLNALEQIDEEVGTDTVTSIGEQIPGEAEWPPGIDSVAEGLESIAQAYEMNHRGNVGSYEVTRLDENAAKVTCQNPYSCALDTGIIRGTAERFSSPVAIVEVDETSTQCREDGGHSCTYEVTW